MVVIVVSKYQKYVTKCIYIFKKNRLVAHACHKLKVAYEYVCISFRTDNLNRFRVS